MRVYHLWDEAPGEWYLIYVTCAFLGILVAYVIWKTCGGYFKSDREKKDLD